MKTSNRTQIQKNLYRAGIVCVLLAALGFMPLAAFADDGQETPQGQETLAEDEAITSVFVYAVPDPGPDPTPNPSPHPVPKGTGSGGGALLKTGQDFASLAFVLLCIGALSTFIVAYFVSKHGEDHD